MRAGTLQGLQETLDRQDLCHQSSAEHHGAGYHKDPRHLFKKWSKFNTMSIKKKKVWLVIYLWRV